MMITNEYNFTIGEQNLIDNNFRDHHDWDRSCFNDIKAKIKRHYISEQEGLCIYCKSRLTLGTSIVHIEHIVPKSRKPMFTFESKNMAVSCAMCNVSKHTTQVLVNTNVTEYPDDGEAFSIVHPHFDNYDEHISNFMGVIYLSRPGSNKGKRTIEVCKLNREQLICQNAELHYQEGDFKQLMINIIRVVNDVEIIGLFRVISSKISELNFHQHRDISVDAISEAYNIIK